MLPERIDFRAPRTIVVASLVLLLAAVPVLSQMRSWNSHSTVQSSFCSFWQHFTRMVLRPFFR
jgi:hypothetical protein